VRRRLALWGPVVAYMAVIFYESSQPSLPDVVSDISDKILHIAGYAVLGALFVRALAGGLHAQVTTSIALLAVLATTLYGVSDEIHQSFVPERQADLQDILADALGGAIAAAALMAWSSLRRRSVR
jgi:VanZ family protein